MGLGRRFYRIALLLGLRLAKTSSVFTSIAVRSCLSSATAKESNDGVSEGLLNN